MNANSAQTERREIAAQLDGAVSEASAVGRALGKWCGNGDYATLPQQARDAAGLRALAELESVLDDLTAVFERLAAAVADPGDGEQAG
ncbi:hypothetical protein [Nocardia sp. IFM 10818]